MSFLQIVLVVLAAFVHAGWNLMAKRAADVGPVFVFFYNLIACLAYAPWVLWLLARGDTAWGWAELACLLLSGLIHLAYSLCLQRSYQAADFSVVYPVARGTGPMLSSIGGFLLLGEMPTAFGVMGLLAVVFGIGLISTDGNLSAFSSRHGRSGLRWGTSTGGLIASYTVVDAYGVKNLGIAPVVLDWSSNVLRFVLLTPLVLGNPRRALDLMRRKWWLALGVGLLSPLSYILVLSALDDGAPLSLVAPMREMSMMVGTLLGMLILQERVGRWRLAGCAVLTCGAAMLAVT